MKLTAHVLPLAARIHAWIVRQQPWQQDLLRRLTVGPLSQEGEAEILKILLEEPGAPTPVPPEREAIPLDRAEAPPVELREIRDLHNINLLAEGQALKFFSGLNIVFGGTGAGKTSLTRLLLRLCQPAAGTEVLGNVFNASSETAPQRAVVQLAVENDLREIEADLAAKPERLFSGIAVFDAVQATKQISGRVPIEQGSPGLLLLQQMAEAQETMRATLGKWIAREEEALALLDDSESVAAGSEAGDGVGSTTAAAGTTQPSAKSLAHKLEAAARELSDARLEAIRDLRAKLDLAIAEQEILAREALSSLPYVGSGRGDWVAMWEAGQRFAASHGEPFPAIDSDAVCPLCQEAIGATGRNHLATLVEFMQADVHKEVRSLADQLSTAVRELPSIDVVAAVAEVSLLAAPDSVVAVVAEVVEALAMRRGIAVQSAEKAGKSLGSPPAIPSLAEIRSYAGISPKGDEDIAGAEQQDPSGGAGVTQDGDSAPGGSRLSERVERLARIDRYKVASVELQAKKISIFVRRLQFAQVTNGMAAAILDELHGLDLWATEITPVGGVAKVRPAISFKLSSSRSLKLAKVLSDGEQRALALALFLAEAATDSNHSALVLDDPTSFLDKGRSEYVARRLVEEAGERQVVLLTHDAAFLRKLQRIAKQAGQDLHIQTIAREGHRAGIVAEGPSLPP